jgi:monoamine oxidase
MTRRNSPPDFGVIVVGAGGAGLAAALSAAEAGASVLLIEATGIPGGSTRLSSGSSMAAGTPRRYHVRIFEHGHELPFGGQPTLGAFVAVAGHRSVDEVPVYRHEVARAEAERRRLAGPQILGEYVDLCNKPLDQVDTLWSLEVNGDARLPPAVPDEGGSVTLAILALDHRKGASALFAL